VIAYAFCADLVLAAGIAAFSAIRAGLGGTIAVIATGL
jgi:hypothetical protein